MVLLGVDVGGTSVRAVACTPDGRVLGRGSSRGGNLRSSPGDAAASIAGAVRTALGGAAASDTADGGRLEAVCLGVAGAGRVRHADVADLVRRALRSAAGDATLGDARLGDASLGDALQAAGTGDLDGADGRARLLTDLDIAYRSAAPGPDGALLLAGTGAVAATYRDWRQTSRRDGLGWLLGDTGSGVWLGRRVLRAVAADLDRNGPPTAMTPHVLAMVSLTSARTAASAAYPRPEPRDAIAPDPVADPHADPHEDPLPASLDEPLPDPLEDSRFSPDAPEQADTPDPAENSSTASSGPELPPRLDVDAQDLVRVVDPLAPADWARFAGIALNAAKTDAVAGRLVEEAGGALLATLAAVRGGVGGADGRGGGGDIVFAGGLLASGPLRARVEAAHRGCVFAPLPVVGACAAAAQAVGVELDREALTDALM
ncbi:MAG: hypothetical protein LCH98_04745 [Actinobacteria bacterium]|nr:hypothetical protein [Actinomycetota bacterium]